MSRNTLSSPPLSLSSFCAMISAPIATASSGLMLLHTLLCGKQFDSSSWILGMRVEPPTSTTSWIASFVRFASRSVFSTMEMVFLNSDEFRSSKRYRLMEHSKPLSSNSMRDVVANDSSCLQFSHASRMRAFQRMFVLMSSPIVRLYCSITYCDRLLSKSSPPRWLSPLHEITSKLPFFTDRMDTSKVPPPKS